VSGRHLTARELGDVLGFKPGTILDKWERGEIPGYKFPPHKPNAPVRFDLEEVLASGRPGGGGVTPATPSAHPAGGVVSLTPATPIERRSDA
jgi:hypothetical protein